MHSTSEPTIEFKILLRFVFSSIMIDHHEGVHQLKCVLRCGPPSTIKAAKDTKIVVVKAPS
jgi:hypothetical protein